MTHEDHVLCPIDVEDDAALLMHHDMARLRTQLDARLRRRGLLLWLLAAVLMGGVAMVLVGWHRVVPTATSAEQQHAQQHTTAHVAEAVASMAAPSVDEDAAPTAAVVSSPTIAALPVLPLSVPHADHSTSTTTPHRRALSAGVEPPAPAPAAAPAPAPAEVLPTPASSRLRAQLDAMAEAQAALQAGDAERAVTVLTTLRATYATGPVDLDAAVLIVRALLALDRLDDARAALAQADSHPHAAERRAALDRLHTQLDAHKNDDDDANDANDDANDDEGDSRESVRP